MKFAVSMALLVLLLGLPMGCILAAHQATAAHPCCPRTGASFACPYDLFDSAKATSHAVATLAPAPVVVGIAPRGVPEELPVLVAAAGNDLYIFHRVLRI